VKSSTSSYL